MASFTDELIQFNPYVSQIPESYHQVGMVKQQQYDQGVATVQGYISSVAGLEVMKGEHRDYLNSRVNELSSHLNRIASTTDFGDQAFINQVGGYAAKLAGDPIISNAVSSTAVHKKNLQYIEEARKKGEDTTRNEWDYQKQLNDWLNDGDIRSSFQGRYSPVVDVMGEFYKAFKEAHPTSSLNQDAFVTDGDGKITFRDDAVLQQVEKEGISPDRVQSVANLVFNRSDVKNQIRIDGQFAYRGFDQASLAESVKKNYQAAIDNTNKDIQDMRTEMATNANADKLALATKIQQRTEAGAKIVNDYKQYAALIATDPEAAKVALYQTNLTSNLINSFAWVKEKRTIIENPVYNQQMKTLEYNLNIAKFTHEQLQDEIDNAFKQSELEIKAEELRIKKETAENKAKGLSEQFSTSTEKANIPEIQGELDQEKFDKDLEAVKKDYADVSAKWIGIIAAESGTTAPKIFKDGNWVWNVGEGGYTSKADAEKAYHDLFVKSLMSHNHVNGATPTPSISKFIEEADKLSRQMQNMEYVKKNIEDRFQPKLKAEEEKLVKNLPVLKESPITVQLKDESIIQISPNEVLKAITGKSSILKAEKNPNKHLTGQEYIFKYIRNGKEEDIPELNNFGGSISTGKFGTWVDKINKAVFGGQKTEEYTRLMKEKQKAYRDAQSAFLPTNTALITSKAEDRATINQIFANKLRSLAEGNGSDEIKDMLEWTVDAKDSDDKMTQNNYGVYYDRFSNKTYMWIARGSETRRVEVPQEMAADIPGVKLQDDFWDKFGADLAVSGNKTTDIRNLQDFSAYKVQNQPTSPYSVKYHLIGDGQGNYSIKLYVWDKEQGSKPLLNGVMYNPPGLTGMMDGQQILKAIDNLKNDAFVKGLIGVNTKK